MGLGKSAQAITAADQINAQRILVICPASVRINWLREFEKFSTRGLICGLVLQSSDLEICLRKTVAGGIVACSYDLATQIDVNLKLSAWLTAGTTSILILDEAHFLKSTTAKRSHAILAKGGLVHQAARVWALSGTPAPNNLAELWPMLRVFGIWNKSYDAFVSKFCQTRHTPYGQAISGHQNIPEFRALIKPIILRRKKADVMRDLPKIMFADVTVPAGPVDVELLFPEYYIFKRDAEFRADLEKQRRLLTAAVDLGGGGMGGLKMLESLTMTQVDQHKISTLRRYTGAQKVQSVVDLVKDELESGLEKIVLFAVHRDVIEGLREGLKDYGPVVVYGGTNPTRRQRNIDKFQRDPKTRVFIGNIQAAGTGINLTAAHHCLFVEQDWVPSNNAQAAMRLHRIGQTKPVTVRIVLLEDDELDRRIQMTLRRKTKDLVAAFD